jgi:hypothetical protein
MAVIDLRGTHGAGKSYVMHALLSEYDNEPIVKKKTKEHLGYYLKELNAVILGKYASVTGGCDGIRTPDEVVKRIKKFNKKYDYVLLEGILVSHTFKRYSKLASKIGDYRFLFLNTPLRTCISRVKKRRKAKGNIKPFDPKNLRKDYVQIWKRTRIKCQEAGHYVKEVDYKRAFEIVKEELTTDENGNIRVR